MGRLLDRKAADALMERLQEQYDVYAPRLFQGTGCFSDTDVVRYGRIDSLDEIVWDRKSEYSFKETLLPISDTIFYFTEDEVKVPDAPKKKRLIFLRSCELCALKRLDDIYLKNGFADSYYGRVREQADFVWMCCEESFASCFCASMGTSHPEQYDAFARLVDGELYLEAEAGTLSELLTEFGKDASVEPVYPVENEEKVEIPETLPADIAVHELWEEYTGRCIGCGRCNFVCPTCTCFTMQDIFYKDNPKAGERRRVWASCQVDGYSDIAGGISFRKRQGERMRFKVLHKPSDFKKRFGYTMCVGCGRCEDACPEYISYLACIRKVNQAAKEARADD